MTRAAYLIAPVRTPFDRRGGRLAGFTSIDLATAAVKGALQAAELRPGTIDRLVFGCATPASLGPNPARQISIGAGIGAAVPAHTVCLAGASGLQAIGDSVRLIGLSEASRVIAVGAEGASGTKGLLLSDTDQGAKNAAHALEASWDPSDAAAVGRTPGSAPRRLALQYGIGPADVARQVRSRRKAYLRAIDERRFDAEIVPLVVGNPDGQVEWADQDALNSLREQIALGAEEDEQEDLRRGEASPPLADGAAAALIVDRETFELLPALPACRIAGLATVGVDSGSAPLAPVSATRKLLCGAGLGPGEIDLFEVGESSAIQLLACCRELRIDQERVNVSGGALMLGHAGGGSGARIVVTLAHEMNRRKARFGVAMIGSDDGLGMALLLENSRKDF